jgi:3-oxoadipate enol-lactonase
MRTSVTLGSRRVSFLETGGTQGRVLVLLHAFPLTADMWQPQLLAVPAGWRFIAPDLAGLGDTDDHTGEPTLDDYAADVLGLMDALAIPRAHVCGLSLGGYITLAVARRAPDRLESLVLADTKAPADNVAQRAARDKLIVTLDEGGVDAVASGMIPRLLGGTTQRDAPQLVEEVRSHVRRNEAAGIRRAILRLRDRPDATPGLSGIRVPTLVLVGEEDVPTPRADAELLATSIKGAHLEIIPGAGHLSNLEQPQAFNEALMRFLRKR